LSLCDISHKVKKELSGEALRALSGHTSRRGAVSPTIDATEATAQLANQDFSRGCSNALNIAH
jgi:hypothetical protein